MSICNENSDNNDDGRVTHTGRSAFNCAAQNGSWTPSVIFLKLVCLQGNPGQPDKAQEEIYHFLLPLLHGQTSDFQVWEPLAKNLRLPPKTDKTHEEIGRLLASELPLPFTAK